MLRIALTLALATLILATSSAAAERQVLLGVAGSQARFEQLTGQKTRVSHVFMSFRQGDALPRIVAGMGEVPMLSLITGSYGSEETATPRDIALGRHDRFLMQLNSAIDQFKGDRFYLRPFPEMNGYWSAACAFNKNGSRRDAAHTTAWARKAFARIAIVSRGGSAQEMTRKLRALGLPGVPADLPVVRSKLRLLWNPQGFGSPNLAGNSAAAYYPGDAYVDVIGDDLYFMAGRGAEWGAAEAMYKRWKKPFAFPEWGLWGVDDPAFIRSMASWVKTHPRTELIAYYSGRPGSPWDLQNKPRSKAAYRTLISSLG